MKTSQHVYEQRVRSYELDTYRHVNNAAYVSWLEDARERLLREQDRDWSWYPDEQDTWIVVVKIDCDYLSAAQANETVRIATRIARLGRTSVVFRQTIADVADGRVRCRARVVMVFTDGGETAVPIPEDFLERFEAAREGDAWTEAEGGERG